MRESISKEEDRYEHFRLGSQYIIGKDYNLLI